MHIRISDNALHIDNLRLAIDEPVGDVGERVVSFTPTPQFWDLWHAQHPVLRTLGITAYAATELTEEVCLFDESAVARHNQQEWRELKSRDLMPHRTHQDATG